MSRPHQVMGALDDETFAGLERLARHFGCTVEHLVVTAVMRFVDEEGRVISTAPADVPAYRNPELDWEAIDQANASFDAFIQRGLDDVEAGRVVPHDEVMRRLRDRYADRQAAE